MASIDMFPKAPTREGAVIKEMRWLLYGPPGIGKSTFFANIPGVLFAHTDPGLRFIKAYKKPILSWGEFKLFAKALDETRPKQYSMIVLDTVDILFRMARKYVCQKRGIEHQSDEQWGKGYELVHDEFEQVIAKLCLLPYGIGFISHSKEVEIRGRSIRTSKIVPTLPKQAHDIVVPLCDIMGYADYAAGSIDKNKAERLIQFQPDETVEAKDRTGLLPKKCKLDFPTVRQYLEGKKTAPQGNEEEETEEVEE